MVIQHLPTAGLSCIGTLRRVIFMSKRSYDLKLSTVVDEQ